VTDLTIFRTYEPWELGLDGYPTVWHDLGRGEPLIWSSRGMGEDQRLYDVDTWGYEPRTPYGVKDLVRSIAEDRCERCGHPYRKGEHKMEEADPQTADQLLHPGLFDELPVAHSQATQGKISWSPCDEHCAHGGPARIRNPRVPDAGWQLIAEDGAAVKVGEYADSMEIQAAWRILTVHHLNGNKADLRWWNLAALCQRCHLHIQKKVVMERVFPFEHTDWFKPYAAGWYAHAYLGQEVTRDEAMERLDELLGLERMA
jgi:hypothetical protein